MELGKWKLSDLYASNSAFTKDLAKAKNYVKNIEKYQNKLIKNDKKILLNYFKEDEEFSVIAEKLAVYARVKFDDNGRNEENIKIYQAVSAFFTDANKRLAFVRTELSSLSDEFLNEIKSDPEFKDFDRAICDIIRQKQHILSEKEEKILASLSSFVTSDDIYDTLTDIEMNHGEFVDEGGRKIKLTTGNFNLLMKSSKQFERKKVYETYLGEYKNLNQTLTNLYLSNVKYMNFISDIRGFNSTLDMLTFDEEVTPDIMLQNIKRVSSKVNLLQEYFELKKKVMNLSKFYTADIFANIVRTKQDGIPYEKALDRIKEAFKILGEDYADMFQKAVDEGWIDAFPRENKASGGYTISNYSNHPYILLNYDGTAYWKSAIAHEFGHAMHSYYSAKNQPYSKSHYTIFVAEVASLTNEILLSHHELMEEKDKTKKVQILAEFLQTFYLNVFNSSMLAELELFVHDSLQKGKELSANDINQKFVSLSKKYFGTSVKFNENYEYDWSRKSHIFRDYYLYKYSTGLISAAAIAKQILSDKTGEYVKKYKEFLSLGGSLDPLSSLKLAGVDITSKKTYDLAFGLYEEYLNNLKEIVNK